MMLKVTMRLRRERLLLARLFRDASAIVTIAMLGACSQSPTDAGSDGIVRWTRASPTAPAFASFPRLAVSDSALFIGYPNLLIAVSVRDGRTLWQRSDVPSIIPVAFGDSVVAVVSAGTSVGLRQATGATLWSRQVPGERSTVPPVMVAGHAVFNTLDGTLWAVEGLSGTVRRLASTLQLADTVGAGVWSIAVIGDTVVVFLQIDTPVGETGAFVVTRVHLPSSTVVSRSRIRREEGEFGSNRRMVVQDSVAVLPINGCAVGVDARTGRRLWTRCINIGQVSLRDGVLFATSGSGELFVLEPLTGRIVRRLDMRVTSPFDQFPCREGIVFVNGGMQIVQNQDGARSRDINRTTDFDGYVGLVRNGTTLFAHGEQSMTALRCN